MPWYDMFRVGKFKKELEEERAKNKRIIVASRKLKAKCAETEKKLSTVERMEALGLRETVSKLNKKKEELEAEVAGLETQARNLESKIIQLDETILLQSFGIYETRYDFEDSSLYKARLDKIRDEQKKMVKDNVAASSPDGLTIDGSLSEGRKLVKDYVKLILRAFNNECDATIVKAKYNNVESLEKKINKAAETLNKLGQRMEIVITSQYTNLKIQELYLSYEYELKKQAEKEEQRRIKEQMREEAKVQREIEKERKKLEKEIKHFNKAIKSFDKRIEVAETDEEREAIIAEKEAMQQEMEKVNVDIANNDFRAKNTRAGHVYIISNIGSFGEGIYKIGMTRRLVPQERVDELGDSSVPFRFDVHAMIFSEDAPSLENALHKAFDHKRVNFVNLRREFFRVSLNEIERVVKNNFNKPVEITTFAKAEEYRQSIQIRKSYEARENLQQAM